MNTGMTPEFEAAFEGAGGPSICCTCGRTNYARDADRAPHEHAQLAMKGNIEHVGDSVYAKLIAGNPYVVGCLCRGVEKVEALLWAERNRIARYLRERSQREASEALSTATALEKALSPEEYARLNPEQPPLEGGKHYADCGESPVGVTCNRPDCRYCATNVFE